MKRFLSILTAVSILVVACVGCNSAASGRRLQTAASGLTSTASVVANEAVSGLSSLISSTTSKLSAKTSGVSKTAASAVTHAAKVIKTAADSVKATVEPGKVIITHPSPSSTSSSTRSSSDANGIIPRDTGGTPIASSSSAAASAAQSAVSSSVAVPNDYNVYEYGRSLLTSSEAACYDALNNGVQNLSSEVSLPATLTYDEFAKVIEYYLYDHTEIFWVKTDFSSDNSGVDDDTETIYIGPPVGVSSIKTLYIIYGYSVSTIQQMQSQMRSSAQALLSGVKASMSDYTKAKTIHDNFIRHIKYNIDAVQSPSSCPHSFDAYGALVQQTAVCEGYAKALKILYDAAGLNSLYITGIGVIDSESGSHAWNMVETGGTWHWVDATFDDPVYSYYDGINTGHETDEYFEMRDSLFQESHIFSEYSESDPENYTDIPDAA